MQENRVALAESASDREVSVREPATENAVRIAKAGFAGVRLQGKPAKAPGLVELLFDSFLQPLAQGLVSGSEIRQMLYRADPYQVDVHIEATPGASKLVVMGQLLDLRNRTSRARCPVTISNLRGHVVQT